MADDPLDAQIIEEDAATIAREYVTRWEELSPYLGLRSQEEEAIRGTFRNYDDQRREALKKWRARKGKSATYRAFMDAANRAGNADLADNVEEFVRTKPPPSPAVSPPVTHLPPPSSPSSVRELTTGDLLVVTGYLMHLSKLEIKTLGLLLGLRDVTVNNTYEGTTQKGYLDSIISAWLRKQDDVVGKGGPNWSTMVKALGSKHLRQTGIALEIRKDN